MSAPLPKNEAERLAALRSYDVLDTPPEAKFDRLTRLASQIFASPISTISLVDEHRQFLKSRLGIDTTETLREHSFCAYCILDDFPLVVCNAAEDERFVDNPLVTGDPRIRFYCGAPLITKDGYRLGSLCVIDRSPRSIPTEDQIQALEDLAAHVVELLELRRAQLDLQDAEEETVVLRSDLDTITREQRSDRERWRRSERKAALALEAGRMGFWEWDAVENHLEWSDRHFDVMGLPVQIKPPTNRQWLRLIHPEDRGLLLERLRELRRSAESFTLKYRLIQSSPHEDRWITSVGRHFFDENGILLGAQGVSWDSTESDRKERALARSESLFRTLSCAAPIGIFQTDLQENTTYVNPRLAAIWEMDPADLVGRKWKSRVHPDDLQDIPDLQLASLPKGTQIQRDYRLMMPDQSIRWVQSRASLVCDSDGKPVGKVGTVDDITERKLALENLRSAKEAAEIASRSKDLFLANVSHELRTPLNGVLGMADLLLETELTDEQREMAEIVRDSGRSLLMVVNDILDLSRIEAGKLVIERTPFHWNAMLRQVVTLIEPEAAKKGLKLELRQSANIPPQFIGDAGRVKQILLVYLTNALKFTVEGSVTIEAVADERVPGETEVLLTVRDTGPGISIEEQGKLFRPFSQIDPSSTRRHGGVGLGLAIARNLAELMGGSVGVVSAQGEGATFWLRLTLPIYANIQPGPSLGSQWRQKSSRKGRVLIVEDNPINQSVAVGMLKKLGWSSDVVKDGASAVDLMQHNQYALVLMDCQMPGVDGYTATRKIREWQRQHKLGELPIVALTAHAMGGDRERCLSAGMNDYLAKPFSLAEMQGVLEKWAQAPQPHRLPVPV